MLGEKTKIASDAVCVARSSAPPVPAVWMHVAVETAGRIGRGHDAGVVTSFVGEGRGGAGALDLGDGCFDRVGVRIGIGVRVGRVDGCPGVGAPSSKSAALSAVLMFETLRATDVALEVPGAGPVPAKSVAAPHPT